LKKGNPKHDIYYHLQMSFLEYLAFRFAVKNLLSIGHMQLIDCLLVRQKSDTGCNRRFLKRVQLPDKN
jgi:hypothetical protein